MLTISTYFTPLVVITTHDPRGRFAESPPNRWHVVQDIVKPSCAKHGAPIALVRNGTLESCGTSVVSCHQWDVKMDVLKTYVL